MLHEISYPYDVFILYICFPQSILDSGRLKHRCLLSHHMISTKRQKSGGGGWNPFCSGKERKKLSLFNSNREPHSCPEWINVEASGLFHVVPLINLASTWIKTTKLLSQCLKPLTWKPDNLIVSEFYLSPLKRGELLKERGGGKPWDFNYWLRG